MRGVAALLLVVGLCGCDESKKATPEAARGKTAEGIELVSAPPTGPIADYVKAQADEGAAQGKQVIVYVGASWCEPCVRFHEAAAAGALDEAFPHLRLLEYDLDRDGDRLKEAGCMSKFIPLFALPNAEGRCQEDRWIMGGVKGDQAVAQITPRLQRLLSYAAK